MAHDPTQIDTTAPPRRAWIRDEEPGAVERAQAWAASATTSFLVVITATTPTHGTVEQWKAAIAELDRRLPVPTKGT